MKWLRGNNILWVFGALLLFVIFSAARIGVADLLLGYARNEMVAWSSTASRPDSSSLNDVSRVLELARFVAPDSPDNFEDSARLAWLHSKSAHIAASEKKSSLLKGLALIRHAIALRPVSPYCWAILLRLKNDLGEYDDEFRRGLERAVTLGPWEPGVQTVVADVGLNAWDALPFAEQEMVRAEFVRGMKRQAETMMYIASLHRKDCPDEASNADCQP